MAVYQSLADRHSDDKQKHADAQLKVGQVEAKVMADERALAVLQSIDLSDVELYKPVRE
jgi:hypothetical protein